jgi:hypothetical protein
LTEPAARACRALFQEIAVVAVGWGPTFIGYWLHDETTTVANAPVVFIDTEGGTMGCTAPTLQDHFLNRAWDQGPEGEASVRSWFEQRGVAFPFADPTAWDLPDLEARFNALVAEHGEGR